MSDPDSGARGQGLTRRLIGVAVTALLALVWACTSPTLSAWTSGVVVDSTNRAAALSLAFSHTTAAGSCSLGPRVSGSTSCPGTVAGGYSIKNTGNALATQYTQSVSAASCATVKLDNAKNGGVNPMLPRFATAFQGAGPWGSSTAISLNGTSAYAASVVQQTLAGANATYGYGVWFKATTAQAGPLFSFGTNPTATAGTGDDRTLVLNANGTLSFTTGAIKVSTAQAYADGNWHFAYVTLNNGVLNTVTTLYVDAAPSQSDTRLAIGYSTPTGYWHLGWSGTSYFGGSLSNFVVFGSGGAPAAPTTVPSSQAAFTTWAAPATEHWLLGDPGTTTWAGAQPAIGASSPCSLLNVDWTFATPTASAVTATQLSAFANGTAYTVPEGPAPGSTQTSTLAISKRTGYNAYIAGLRLYIPWTVKESLVGGGWPLTFTWSSADSVVIAP